MFFGYASVALSQTNVPEKRELPEHIKNLYAICLGCHRSDGRPGGVYHAILVDLRKTSLDHDGLIGVIALGRLDRGMPGYKGLLSDKDIEKLATFIEKDFKDRR